MSDENPLFPVAFHNEIDPAKNSDRTLFTCHDCVLQMTAGRGTDFMGLDAATMTAHLQDHQKAGHRVRQSIFDDLMNAARRPVPGPDFTIDLSWDQYPNGLQPERVTETELFGSLVKDPSIQQHVDGVRRSFENSQLLPGRLLEDLRELCQRYQAKPVMVFVDDRNSYRAVPNSITWWVVLSGSVHGTALYRSYSRGWEQVGYQTPELTDQVLEGK